VDVDPIDQLHKNFLEEPLKFQEISRISRVVDTLKIRLQLHNFFVLSCRQDAQRQKRNFLDGILMDESFSSRYVICRLFPSVYSRI